MNANKQNHRLPFKITSLFLAALFVVVLVAGCAPGTTPTADVEPADSSEAEPAADESVDAVPSEGGTLVMGVVSSPGGMYNPGLAPNSYAGLINHLIFPTLFRWNEEGTALVGNLVESWEQNEDFTEMTMYLNQDAVWTDGTPITSADIEYTLWVLSHPEIESNRGGVIQWIAGLEGSKRPEGVDEISGIEVIDDHTIRFTFTAPLAEIAITEPLGVWMQIIPKHVLEDIPPEEFNDADFWQNPTVTGGPFQFVEYRTDEYVELASNPDFYLGAPKVETLIVKVVNSATLAAQLEKGEIDMTGGTLGTIPLEEWDRIASLPYIETHTESFGRGQRLQINAMDGRPFDSALARQAVAHAINRPLILSRLFNDMGVITNNARLAPNSPYHNAAVDELYQYDPDKARELLAEANWDPDTVVDLLVPTGDQSIELIGDIILANLQDVGIQVNLRKYDYATMLTFVRSGKKDYDLAMVGGGVDIDPQMSYFEALYSGGSYNYSYAEFPELDAAIDEVAASLEPENRVAAMQAVQEEVAKVMPFVQIYYPVALNAVNERVHEVTFPNGYMAFLQNAHEWWVDPKE